MKRMGRLGPSLGILLIPAFLEILALLPENLRRTRVSLRGAHKNLEEMTPKPWRRNKKPFRRGHSRRRDEPVPPKDHPYGVLFHFSLVFVRALLIHDEKDLVSIRPTDIHPRTKETSFFNSGP